EDHGIAKHLRRRARIRIGRPQPGRRFGGSGTGPATGALRGLQSFRAPSGPPFSTELLNNYAEQARSWKTIHFTGEFSMTLMCARKRPTLASSWPVVASNLLPLRRASTSNRF